MKKNELKHGHYYTGECRNANVARWNADEDCFYIPRYKFGRVWFDCIVHADDDDGVWDVFTAVAECEPTDPPIRFALGEGT